MSGFAGRYGPAIGFAHLGLLLMALDFGFQVMTGGNPMTPEIYGPAVYSIPAWAWVLMQVGGSSIAFAGAFFTGNIRAIMFLVGGLMSGVLFAAFTAMASGAAQGIVLEAGSRWLATPICTMTAMAGWGALNVRRRN